MPDDGSAARDAYSVLLLPRAERDGKYRVLYTVDDTARRIIVYAVGHRKDIYQ